MPRLVGSTSALSLLGLLMPVLAWPAMAEPVKIVAIGDSNTYGYELPREQTYPAQLETLLRAKGHDVVVVNAGQNGDMTAETMTRLVDAVPDDADAAIVFLGRNDHRKSVPEPVIARNLDVIVGHLRSRGIEVLLVGFSPADFSAVAAKNGALYYPDFFSGVMTLGRKRGKYVIDGDLGRHLNAEGYAVVVGRMAPTVEALIERVQD
ncbi:MAG TPA: GDSL-type esterase/lipase family protein [Bauldia sp.]|nr:GDSL-type esterase/lipase family protein [Bauldia sp.]